MFFQGPANPRKSHSHTISHYPHRRSAKTESLRMNTVDVICTIPSDQGPPCTEQEACIFHFDDHSDSTPMNYCVIAYGQEDKKAQGWEIKNMLSTVMINFMCQLGCIDFGETLFPGVCAPVKVFLDEISI